MNSCKWIRNDNTKCTLQSITGKHYCKLHKKYENIYDPTILHTLLRCKRCKQICDSLNDKDKCEKCMIRQNKMISKRKLGKTKCKWVNQKQEPCPFNSTYNSDFCNHHKKYANKVIENMTKCSSCNNLFEQENKEKVCLTCKYNAKNIRNRKKANIKYCKAIVKRSGKPCRNKQSSENEYCKLHQTYKKIKELEDAGYRVCSNKNRGCLNILDYDDKSKCKICKSLANNTKTPSSKLLYEKQIVTYKSEAKRRNILWNLTPTECINLFKNKCFYCDYTNGLNGIDRCDSSKSYELSNVVSCCKYCNIMKNTKSCDIFKEVIIHLYNTLVMNNSPNYDNHTYFEISNNKTYNTYKSSSYTRHISFQIDSDTFYNTIKLSCYYCKLFPEGCNGIDRLNSNGPYDKSNIVPCCKTCNSMKNDLSIECFKSKIHNIYKKFVLQENINYDDPKTLLLTLLTQQNYKICTFKPIRMIKTHAYYQSKIFNGIISNIDIGLKFVDSSQKLDYSMWQYYRRYISSFRKKDTSQLVGKQIYIIVKDNKTDTCLGIISLSSDLKYLKARDNHIGWNSKEYLTNKKINYILNISTCVSTQPFGFNYNGGKLLTSLVFSKEVIQHIKNKYGIFIQGFTTMSLYGKSIQYERLPCVKFVGYTNGSSLTNISQNVVDYCKYYLEENNISSTRDNLWAVTKTLKHLNIPVEDFLKSNKKGIYFGYTHKNSKDFLNGKLNDEPNSLEHAKTIKEIYYWWLERWGKQRFEHLKNTNRVKTYDECMKDITAQIE
jgi:hypothetical protein